MRSTQEFNTARLKVNEATGLDFSRKVPEIENSARDRSRSARPAQTELSQQRNRTYLYQVLQPGLKDRHEQSFKEIVSRNNN